LNRGGGLLKISTFILIAQIISHIYSIERQIIMIIIKIIKIKIMKEIIIIKKISIIIIIIIIEEWHK